MIKFYDQVPRVYPNASRDFQYLSWLIDIVLNSVKHNVDDLYDLPNSKNNAQLTELLALTLGFKLKRNYDQDQLSALVAVLPRILKCKGTRAAIEMAGNALVAASGTTGKFAIDEERSKDGEVAVVLPVDLVDVSLFSDLLSYILPAGMTVRVIREQREIAAPETRVAYKDQLLADWVRDLDWTETRENTAIDQTYPGLANMFDIDMAESAVFTNYRNEDRHAINTGLLNNSVIPTLAPGTVMTHTIVEATPVIPVENAEVETQNLNNGDA